ncbi:hypothetical protein SALBM217S_01534 [Streptomyces griseoloalbus]
MMTRGPWVALVVCTSSASATTEPMNSRSSARELRSGVLNCRSVPVRRQTRSMTPTVTGVRNSSTAEAVRAFSSSSVTSKPPSSTV